MARHHQSLRVYRQMGGKIEQHRLIAQDDIEHAGQKGGIMNTAAQIIGRGPGQSQQARQPAIIGDQPSNCPQCQTFRSILAEPGRRTGGGARRNRAHGDTLA